MAVIFSTDSLGSAVAIPAKGVAPLITFDVDPQINKYSLSEGARDLINVSPFVRSALGPASFLGKFTPDASLGNLTDFATLQANKLGGHWSDWVKEWFGEIGGSESEPPSMTAIRAVAADLGERRRLQRLQKTLKDPVMQAYVNQVLRNTERAEMSLTQLVAGIGIITSITLNFDEQARSAPDGQLTGPNGLAAGAATISGLVFERMCGSTLTSGRHGLENLLEYYYWHRVSNAKDKPISTMSFTVGKTKISGWVVGFSFSPADTQFRLWSWEVRMAVTPDYFVDRRAFK